MKYLFLNSMSRTGGSLLYGLLYGHPDIYPAPYRIQFVCTPPFGFPLNGSCADKAAFFDTLLTKTTIVDKKGQWPDITTDSIKNLFPQCNLAYLIEGGNPLESAVLSLHNILGLARPHGKYYLLYDDHSYMLGSRLFARFSPKILTTIRHPFDMIASKKNMLTLYVYGQQDPQQFQLKAEVLYKECLRACFCWWVASYEYAEYGIVPALFSLLKSKDSRESMICALMRYLELEFNPVVLDEHTPLQPSTHHNELLANGSSINSIAYLTKGRKTDNTKAQSLSLNDAEKAYLTRFVDPQIFTDMGTSVDFFLAHFATFHKNLCLNDETGIFAQWQESYRAQRFDELFMQYSAFNFGRVNAHLAFEVAGGGHLM